MQALNILVVDDANFIRDLVKKAVKAQFPSAKVDDAVDGLKAQSMMKSGSYHVILCDWEMPNMSGLEVLQWMRSDERYAKIPFMMITSRSEKSHIVKAVQAGVSEYIGKPFSNEQLGSKLGRLIKKFYSTSPAAQQAPHASSDNASLLTGGGGAVPVAKAKPQAAASSASLLAGNSQTAQLIDTKSAGARPSGAKKKTGPSSVALAHVRTSDGQELRCIVKDINLNEMMLIVKREEGVPRLFDQVVVDIVSKTEDIVARVNCFVSATTSPDKRIDGEIYNMMVRYDDVDPEKLEALSKFVAKIR
jgi:CheY-like chemotaxis protein